MLNAQTFATYSSVFALLECGRFVRQFRITANACYISTKVIPPPCAQGFSALLARPAPSTALSAILDCKSTKLSSISSPHPQKSSKRHKDLTVFGGESIFSMRKHASFGAVKWHFTGSEKALCSPRGRHFAASLTGGATRTAGFNGLAFRKL